MKAILISDHSKWCALMMNGKKKVEVRKGTALYKATQKLIDEYGFAEFYVYCTKGKPNLWLPYERDCFELDEASQPYLSDEPIIDIDTKMNGKVIFKFRCYKVEEIKTCDRHNPELLHLSCLSANEFYDYLTKGKNFLGQVLGCAIHISNLEIFDEPKELSEFIKCDNNHIRIGNCFIGFGGIPRLTKAPQNFCYVEVE